MTIEIEYHETSIGAEWVLLINGGHEGIYRSEASAKLMARRFISSHEGLQWNALTARIVPKRRMKKRGEL